MQLNPRLLLLLLLLLLIVRLVLGLLLLFLPLVLLTTDRTASTATTSTYVRTTTTTATATATRPSGAAAAADTVAASIGSTLIAFLSHSRVAFRSAFLVSSPRYPPALCTLQWLRPQPRLLAVLLSLRGTSTAVCPRRCTSWAGPSRST